MHLVKKINQYNDNFVFFCDPIKNNIMNEGNFIRILYSTKNVTLNGIYLLINLKDVTCERYYNKYKCIFNTNIHKDLIEDIKIIEENIIQKFKDTSSIKYPEFKIYEQFKNGFIKIFKEIQNKTNHTFILKISGVWETNSSFGLTYKFMKVND
jgi:Zn-dependent M16 (insulinase) family peptidase